jgi:ubiquinone/menaquinone biosynthesis C-methylase UbiE
MRPGCVTCFCLMASNIETLAFGAFQQVRTSWFFGQKLLAARLGRPVRLPAALRDLPMPGRDRILADLRLLFEQDRRNVEAGRYAAPAGDFGSPIEAVRRALDFFADLPAVEKRRHAADAAEIAQEETSARYPRYYRQNFHFQTDGYLSAASAERYDHQVEVLFGGGAAAMRRQALIPLKTALSGVEDPGLVDIGCGTGRFLRSVKENHPRLRVTGLDLSPYYLAVARRELQPWSRVRLVEGAAEATPFAEAEFDAATCVYLFHELPPRVRRAVIAEIARILRPNGVLILVDSLQIGDEPDYDAMLEAFPYGFHEPYYRSYLAEDLDSLTQRNFLPGERSRAYFSKVLTYRKRAEPLF